MGLECGIVLNHKIYEDVKIEYGYYGRFYPLRNWIIENCEEASAEGYYHLSEDNIQKIITRLDNIGSWLISQEENMLWYYDENSYPDVINIKFYLDIFNPAETQRGYLTRNLYLDMLKLKTLLEDNSQLYALFWISE